MMRSNRKLVGLHVLLLGLQLFGCYQFLCMEQIGATSMSSSKQEEEEVVSISYQELADAFGTTTNKDNDEENNNGGEEGGEVTSSSSSSSVNNSCRRPAPPQQHLLTAISKAFGPNGLGFLEISNIPSEMINLRQIVLELAPKLASLPQSELDTLIRPETMYTIGWSHGKEQFGTDINTGQPLYDTQKGSFYVDPYRTSSFSSSSSSSGTTTTTNVFPSDSLPTLEPSLLEVTQWMTQTALWIAQLCDAYLLESTTKTSTTTTTTTTTPIFDSLETRQNTKARLLYYFPSSSKDSGINDENKNKIHSDDSSLEDDDDDDDDDWCGWHKDHGSLTALLPGLLFDKEEEEGNNDVNNQTVDELETASLSSTTTTQNNNMNNKKKKPGLYIQTRNGNQVLVQLPSTSIGIQLGETLEIMSGGRLRATPHAVMSGSSSSSGTTTTTSALGSGGRASLAVFLQPEPHQPLPECPLTADNSLQQRYRPTFGEFQQATTQAFQ